MKSIVTIKDTYAVYRNGDLKYYRAVLVRTLRLKVSRRKFSRAAEAVEYRVRVLARYSALKKFTPEVVNG